MPTITPGRDNSRADARVSDPENAAALVTGWCADCYTDGEAVLAAEPDGTLCGYHVRLSAIRRGGGTPPAVPDRPPSRECSSEPLGASTRPGQYRGGRGARAARRSLVRSVGRARALRYGRERAAARVRDGRWAAHPGWRHRVDPEWVVLDDQVAVLRRIEQLVDAEHWRADKRASWAAMLRRLVYGMDWTTGLVAGTTRAHLGAAGGRAERTVSSLIAWAVEVELLVVLEQGASAAWLGTKHNRAPTYAFVAPLDEQPHPASSVEVSTQVNADVDTTCNLPASSGWSLKPLTGGKRLIHPQRQSRPSWPLWQIPTTPAERSTAVSTLLAKIGLDGGRVPRWRAHAMLIMWFRVGWCLAGLLYAIDHSPDGTARGDAIRGARDPLKTIGARLRPWCDHLDQLPAHLHGRSGDYRAEQAARLARLS